MNLWFRTLIVYLMAWRRPKAEPLDELSLRLRVWPTDIDIAFHMNNGRYLTVADLGRWEFLIRSGFWPTMRKNGWHPVVGTSKIWHRRSLLPFQAFDLKTQLLGWDEKWIYIEHRFVGVGDKAGDLYCRIVIKGLFLKGKEKVTSEQLVEAMGFGGQAPDMDPALLAMME